MAQDESVGQRETVEEDSTSTGVALQNLPSSTSVFRTSSASLDTTRSRIISPN